MQTIGIRELQTNPAIFTKALENNEFTMITKRSTPIGVAIAFDDAILSKGLKTSLLIEAYKNGWICLKFSYAYGLHMFPLYYHLMVL